jgi:hypothetical protein
MTDIILSFCPCCSKNIIGLNEEMCKECIDDNYPPVYCMKCNCVLDLEADRHGAHCYGCHIKIMDEQLNPQPKIDKAINYKEMPDFFEPSEDELPF